MMSNTLLASLRGMHDVLPEHIGAWHVLERTLRHLMSAYQYGEIRTPIVEKTLLFSRAIGMETDIVEKEMYAFEDRNGDAVCLRPENTASCARAGIEHGLFHNCVPRRLWYNGPMFRHERPQKGRYRQFYQVGAEFFGMAGPQAEAELIFLSARLWRLLGIDSLVTLEINSLGSAEERRDYHAALVAYLRQHIDVLDKDSQRRLETNPLRVLDSKCAATRACLKEAPKLQAFLGRDSEAHFASLTELLTRQGIEYRVNPFLVRGLDYYNHTVFEWVTDQLGSQGAVCAGGRYDGLVEQLGGKPTPGAGWAIGMERLLSLMQLNDPIAPEPPCAYLVLLGESATTYGMQLAEYLRDKLPTLSLVTDISGTSIKSQLKRADTTGAKAAIILGDAEMENNKLMFKPLDGTGAQQLLSREALIETLSNFLTI